MSTFVFYCGKNIIQIIIALASIIPSAPCEIGPLGLANDFCAAALAYLDVVLVAALDALLESQSVVQDSRFVDTTELPEKISHSGTVGKDIDESFGPAYQQA